MKITILIERTCKMEVSSSKKYRKHPDIALKPLMKVSKCENVTICLDYPLNFSYRIVHCERNHYLLPFDHTVMSAQAAAAQC